MQGRRSFLSTLFAGSTAASVLANVPEPERVEKIKLNEGEAYALCFDEPICEEQWHGIRTAWNATFGADAPRLIILDGGAKLQKIDLREPDYSERERRKLSDFIGR